MSAGLGLLLSMVVVTGEGEPERFAVRAGKVFTAAEGGGVLHDGVVLVEGAKIAAVGAHGAVPIPEGTPWVEAPDAWLVPGFVDCHDHIAGSLNDLNDGVYGTNPGLRTMDLVDPFNQEVRDALADGVSTVLLIPGSGNNMSGFGTVVKLHADSQEDMILRAPGSLKIAQGDNPKRYWFGQERSFMAFNIRATLTTARDYHRRWKAWEEDPEGPRPDFDPAWEGFRGLFEREFPVSVHTQRYQLVMESIVQLHDEFGLWTVLDHSTMSGFFAAPLAVSRQIEVIVGPRQLHFDSNERKISGCAAEWWERGVRKIGINTDAPVIGQHDLRLQAAMAVHFGLPSPAALVGLTRIPAIALGVGERCGSIEVGKDADFALWNGDPLDMASRCQVLWVDGSLAHDGGELDLEGAAR